MCPHSHTWDTPTPNRLARTIGSSAFRKRDITPIAKRSRKKRRPEGSQLEADAHPVAIGGTIDGRCPGFGPADGEEGPPCEGG